MSWIYKIGVGTYFSKSQQENNAIEFYAYFHQKRLTLESICGMLGNITRESTLNPGIKQGSSTSSGWGLIQWTPATVLTNWCNKYGYNWYDGTAQCERIIAEGDGTRGASGYWVPTSNYPYSWTEFKSLTDVDEATKAYLYERERAGVEALELRLQYAKEWYEYLSGEPTPPIPPKPTKKVKKFPWYLYLKKI